ncbi:ATP-binding protein [Kibdelosporangium phytohabitans]|uniref:LuxR family transcriptional regulator n=1 Tax=Kibdelosporangium phytohabitans TaxID=860235 RepID=A0A0N9IAS7_9PSEU|nr:LuxR family transcriptional regulator [Kibdelosporangium phytohabitans]ALG13469.1 LuxR family transcriptional regulator [Kibdelosporangium phytohabitans]MBE1465317.1 DNA-binding CsgD family transcriptional regulator [Kibdelosporangium phytohabitans]
MTSPVLVGRGEELALLTAAVANAPSVVFVEGEEGVGKTRLVAELPGSVVGHCQPLRDPFPYGVIFECLGACADRLTGRLGAITGALRPYLPELADRLPPTPEPLGDPAAERHRLFRAIRDLISAMGRLTLVIEDIHWADEGTRQLLRFVLTNQPPELSLVLTYRREDLPGGTTLGRAFRPQHSTHVVLRPLDTNGVRDLAEAILRRPVTPEFATTLHKRTAGIPFVVEETMHALRNPDARLLDTVEVPASLREAMIERLDGLPTIARGIAEAAAVLGVPAGIDGLSAIAVETQARTQQATMKLLEAGVLIEPVENKYGYRHALARRTVYESLPGPRRQELHLRSSRVLSRLDPIPLVQVAEHCRRAGLIQEWLRYGEQAADAAMDAGDASTALELRCALVSEPEVPPADVDRLATKLCQDALTGLHQHEVTAQFERLLADQRLSDEVRGEVQLGLGLILVRGCDEIDRGRSEIEMALPALAHRSERVLRGMAVLAMPYLSTAPLAEHMVWLRKVEQGLPDVAVPSVRIALLANVLGARIHMEGEIGSVDPPHADDPECTRQLARLYNNVADSYSWVGHYRLAAKYLRTGLDLATRSGAPYVVGTAEATRIRLDWLAGEWSGLDERARQLTEVYEHLHPVATELSLVRGWLATAQGDWGCAVECFQSTGLDAPEKGIAPAVIAAFGGMVTLLLARDDPEAAAREADTGAEVLRRKGVWSWGGEFAAQAVDAYLRVGRTADAHELTRDFETGLVSVDAPLARAALAVCRAHLGYESYEIPRRLYENLGQPYRVAQLAERLAHTPEDLNDLAVQYEALGATTDAARCRHIIRTSGGPIPSRRGRRGYGNELSPREHDVARLLAAGQTNRQIASALFLSRRTVEQHVANILRKLGVSSRQDLLS